MQKCARTCDRAGNLPILFDVKPNNRRPVVGLRCAKNHALAFPCSIASQAVVLADQGSSWNEVVPYVLISLSTANGSGAEIIHAKPGVAMCELSHFHKLWVTELAQLSRHQKPALTSGTSVHAFRKPMLGCRLLASSAQLSRTRRSCRTRAGRADRHEMTGTICDKCGLVGPHDAFKAWVWHKG
jgi:hypothetical protein